MSAGQAASAAATAFAAVGAAPVAVEIAAEAQLDAQLVDSARALLRAAVAAGPAGFSTSFGAEDMVLLDLIVGAGLPIAMFTLDTGRLPEETYALMQAVEQRYGRCVQTLFPAAAAVEALVARIGINGFRASVANRQACCAVRKLEPLARALAGKRAWVTGLRAGQSAHRTGVLGHSVDAARGLEKFNPLHDWSEAQVWGYLRRHAVPYNALHDRFYPSIGCAPCTRAIAAGEDRRAGRWWWEQESAKECGLHPSPARGLPLQERG